MSNGPQSLVAGRYRLVSPLGQGGMGRVWLARDEMLRRDVAIKELVPPPGLTDDERREMRERSLREARAIARLDQSNVVRIFDVLHADGEPWIVMEFVPSRSLQAVLTENGPLPPAEVAKIGLAVLAALRAAHRAGLLHRDVKPGNVLLANDGRVVLTDFGLATAPDDPSMTRTGVVLGSPSYLAPERLTDYVIGPASDLWSLGATLYDAVEGKPPYARSSAVATVTAIATELPPPPKHAGALTPVLAGLLRKDPSQRIDADEAERLLRQAITEQPSPASASAPGSAAPGSAAPGSAAPGSAVPSSAGLAGAAPEGVPARSAVPQSAAAVRASQEESTQGRPVGPASPAQEPARTPAANAAAATANATAKKRKYGWLIAAAVVAVGLVGVIAVQPLINKAGADDVKQDPVFNTSMSTTSMARPGWHYYTQDPSFSVPVPDGWQQLRDGRRVEFRELDGRRVLTVEALGAPKADLLADARSAEAADRESGKYPTYERVHLREVNYRTRAVDREWTYADSGGTRMHALSRTFVAENGQAYKIQWITPDGAWAAGQHDLALILDGFRVQQAPVSPSAGSTLAGPTKSAPTKTPSTTKGSTLASPRYTGRPIINNGSGKCIDVPDSNPNTTAEIQMWDCHGVDGEKFTLGANHSVRVLGKCLELRGTSNGSKLRIATCTGSDIQKFTLNTASDLVSLGPIKCVEPTDGNPGNGVWLQIVDCNGRDHQKWHLG
ncbi:protein kinase domain-containing protein [Micromonospora sp. NPDC003197]